MWCSVRENALLQYLEADGSNMLPFSVSFKLKSKLKNGMLKKRINSNFSNNLADIDIYVIINCYQKYKKLAV